MKKLYSALALFLSLTGVSHAALLTVDSPDTIGSTVDYFSFSIDPGNTSLVDLYTVSSTPYNPSLSLWYSSSATPTTTADWSLVGSNDNSATWSLLNTANSLDAELKSVLASGSYLVTVAGTGITAAGSLLSNGFTGSTTQTFLPYQVEISGNVSNLAVSAAPAAVPLPAAVWMFGTGLMGFLGLSKRRALQQREI